MLHLFYDCTREPKVMEVIVQGSRTAESHVVPVISQTFIKVFVGNQPSTVRFAREAEICVAWIGLAQAVSRGPSGSRAD